MKRCCCHNTTLDPVFVQAFAEAFNEKFVTTSLVFRKPGSINLVLFKIPITLRTYLDVPKRHSENYETDRIKFFKKCLELLESGWKNDMAEEHLQKIKEIVSKSSDGEVA